MGSVARVTEISARSEESFEDATRMVIRRANQTLRNLRSGWIKEQQVTITDGEISSFQVNLVVTFELDE